MLDLKDSTRVQDLLGTNSAKVLANRPGTAAAVADQLKCRVLVYGVLWADPGGTRYIQLTGVDCRFPVARVYATPPLPWPGTPEEQRDRLRSALQAVLPPVGRVIAAIDAEGKTELQVYPFGGIPLHTDTLYLAYQSQGGRRGHRTPGVPRAPVCVATSRGG